LRKRKKKETSNSLGLFDHLKQITQIQDPDYFDNLTEADKKSFNHFIILKGLSMNPDNLEAVCTLYKYFDVVPSSQFYKLLISFIRPDPNFYPWIKAKNKHKEELVEMISKRFEVTNRESEEYINLLSLTEDGRNSLVYICQEFGKTDKEIEQLLSNNDNDEQ
jgi:hypothetical protein